LDFIQFMQIESRSKSMLDSKNNWEIEILSSFWVIKSVNLALHKILVHFSGKCCEEQQYYKRAIALSIRWGQWVSTRGS
jgi:hypothetical protein